MTKNENYINNHRGLGGGRHTANIAGLMVKTKTIVAQAWVPRLQTPAGFVTIAGLAVKAKSVTAAVSRVAGQGGTRLTEPAPQGPRRHPEGRAALALARFAHYSRPRNVSQLLWFGDLFAESVNVARTFEPIPVQMIANRARIDPESPTN